MALTLNWTPLVWCVSLLLLLIPHPQFASGYASQSRDKFSHQSPPSQVIQARPHQILYANSVRQNDPSEDCRSGFSVRKALRTTLKSKTHVKFQEVLTNAGGWDSGKHSFVAPCPGIYFFTFNAVSEDAIGFTLALMKNDTYQVTAYGGKSGYQWGSNSAMLFLNPGDVVYLQLQDGEIYEHPFNEAYTSFTGFLVNKF